MGFRKDLRHLMQELKQLTEKQKDADTLLRERIELFEKEAGYRLPADYRQFLLDGGNKDYSVNTFDVYADDDDDRLLYSFMVQKYLKLNPGEKDDILYNLLKLRNELPSGDLLPIAFDRFRNIMMISLVSGRVYFWDYYNRVDDENDPALEEPPDRLYYVAPSFGDFHERLYRHKRFH